MQTFPKYDSYKDTDVSWLGKVPSHWGVLPFKALFNVSLEKNGKNIVGNMLSVSGYRGIEEKHYEHEEQKRSEKDLMDYRVVRKGQLVVNTMWLNYAGLGVSELEGHVSPAYRSYWVSEQLHRKYAHYLLRCHLYVEGYTGLMQGIRPNSLQIKNNDFHKIPVLVPEYGEQQRIANFLDQKIAEIDEAIVKKQRLIELLKEQKAILINQAVTKGLNPNAPMCDSGVEWIGDIPAHWEIKKLKYVTRIFRGKFTHRPRNDPNLYDGMYPFFQTGDVARAEKYLSQYSQTLNEKGLRVSTLVPKGTVVITIAANIGDIAILAIDACFPDSVVGFEPKQMERDYLYYALVAMKEQFIGSTTKNTQMNLNVDRIGSNFIALPTQDEQIDIAKHIQGRVDYIEKVQRHLAKNIGCLNEYKSILIASTVTGKIKI